MGSTAAQSLSPRIGGWRLLVALIALPLFDVVLGYAAFPVMWWLGDHGAFYPITSQQVALNFGMLAGVLGLLVMITAALPATLYLIRRAKTSIHHFALAGALAGNLPFAVYLWIVLVFVLVHLFAGTLSDHLSSPLALLTGGMRAILIGSSIGAASGAMFWLIAVRHQSHVE